MHAASDRYDSHRLMEGRMHYIDGKTGAHIKSTKLGRDKTKYLSNLMNMARPYRIVPTQGPPIFGRHKPKPCQAVSTVDRTAARPARSRRIKGKVVFTTCTCTREFACTLAETRRRRESLGAVGVEFSSRVGACGGGLDLGHLRRGHEKTILLDT